MAAAEDPARAIVDIITGTWRAQALHAAVTLGLADHVAAGCAGPVELARRAGAPADRIERLIRLLVSMGVVEGGAGGYRLTAVGELLRTGVPGSLRDLVSLYGAEFHQVWGSFAAAVASGRSGFEEAFGRTLGEYLAADPAASERFQRAMAAGNAFFAAVPAVHDFSSCATVVDVAGGSGALLAEVLRASPGTRGVLVDLPHATPIARRNLGAAFGPERFEVLAGDVFEAVPPGAGAYLLSRVLQDWEDDACVKLLSNCRTAMPEGAALLIVERVIPAEVSAGTAGRLPLLWDLHLMTMAGGRQRTLDGYESVLSAAGLRLRATHPLPLETTLLIAVHE
jgi:hypothetical protein